jgi:hypothetical protein
VLLLSAGPNSRCAFTSAVAMFFKMGIL